jgi:hypothetical protein
MDTNIHDVEAAGDVFAALAEASDDLSAEEAICYMEALRAASEQLKAAISLVETQLKKLLDSPKQIGDKVWVTKPTGKYRPDHAKVRRHVLRVAVADENGEIRSAEDAAKVAYELMYGLYVQESALPKVSGLEQLGLDRVSTSRWENTGTKIETIDLKGPEDA